MALAEGVLLEVGSQVANILVRLWLKQERGAGGSRTVNDLLAAGIPSPLQRRRTGRQFDQLAERVAAKLEPLVEVEFATLPDNEKAAAVGALATALGQSELRLSDIIEVNLDAEAVEAFVRSAAQDATRDLSEAAAALYELVLRESCTYIVDLLEGLPEFSGIALRELLHREGALIDRLQEVLDSLPLAGAGLASDASLAFEFDYERALVRKLDDLELFGVTLAETTRRYALSVAYITLTVTTRASSAAEALAQDPTSTNPQRPRPSASREPPVEDDDGARLLRVDDALGRTRRMLIRGEAGSGKTTLLQWLGVMSGGRRFDRDGPLSGWNEMVPFFVQLRHYVDADLPAPESFLQNTVPQLAGALPHGWVHRQLTDGRALVLVDGVDELPESQRSDARQWIKNLVEAYPKATYVLTSRPAAVSERWLRDTAFDSSELQPMTLPDISAFIDHWHDAVRTGLTSRDARDELDERRGGLKTIIRDTPAIRTIATTPLLCALLCALNRDRKGQVPKDRVELYRIALEMLLDRRDVERQVAASVIGLSLPQKELLLRHFAYWLAVNERSDSDKSRLIENIQEKVALMQIAADAKDVAAFLLVRSGVLREPIPGRVDFIHRTFQEYFTADEAVRLDHIALLIRHAHLDQWQEVVVLAVGRATLQQRVELLRGLLDRGDQEPERSYRLHLLAVACLETAYELPVEMRAEVNGKLEGLVPPSSMADARAVASAGEVAIPLLEKHLGAGALIAACCVRAIASVGGSEALRALARCAKDTRKTVIRELIRAWQNFDTERFADEVLRESPLDAGALVLRDPELLRGLPYLVNARALVCRFRPRDEWDIALITARPELESVSISGAGAVRDLHPLTRLRNLRTVALTYCLSIEDIAPLADLSTLEYLGLTGCESIREFRALRRLPHLRHLRLGLTRFRDTDILRELYDLQSLSLASCPLDALDGIDEVTDLALLEVSGCRGLDSIHDLARLASLRYLFLADCVSVREFSAIGEVSDLRYLDLSGCYQLADLGFLEPLTNLEALDVTNCGLISDASVLSNLPRLETVKIAGTAIRDLTPLFERAGLDIAVGREIDLAALPGAFCEANRIHHEWTRTEEYDAESGDDDYEVDLDEDEPVVRPRDDLEAIVAGLSVAPRLRPVALTVSAADYGYEDDSSLVDADLADLDLSSHEW